MRKLEVVSESVENQAKMAGRSTVKINQMNEQIIERINTYNQWDFQDPKMEILYHLRSYFVSFSLTYKDR
jgi:sulfur relay (sulfurtransferase) DsrC/TusE family protein